MSFLGRSAGLIPEISSPPVVGGTEDVVTEETAVRPGNGAAPAVTPLVREGDLVAAGAAVACLRHAPDVCFVAPVAGRVARLSLLPGRRLSEIVLFREASGDVERHDTADAGTAAGLRRLMQGAGIWPWLRRRPFGGMPAHNEVPAAIAVMAADTRPLAPDPATALEGREEAFLRGVAALETLTDGPVLIFSAEGARIPDTGRGAGRIRRLICGARHPQGSAGIRIHQAFPAGLEAPVWDIHAEDVAAFGTLLETGVLPMLRLVRIGGPALREGRLLRTHPGADLRQLTRRIVAPGQHVVLAGSVLDGRPAQWLGPRDRQVSVLPREGAARKPHWLIAALSRSAIAPAIPSAGLDQAFGGALPALPFIRALAAGDDETAMKLGLLSLLEEDVALADYVLSEEGQITAQLRAMLDRIQSEFAP
ncbi:Na(+)-translocating NADH-quinone reductase subunit A [Alphaproteobacteria bacterium GH1-50]|uniref:Na(+)-translocating NADH-quinone reductase subunit A n=1 Tax=Kangsaoukella pontilimi TaxID=2691042 RepID=A0A7C9J5A5_9RHOB|nr:Na(+)-translocating NADH-quinone reductase subunit A [Kangsaoukella pontilimi]